MLVSCLGGFAIMEDLERDMAILANSGRDWADRTKRLGVRLPISTSSHPAWSSASLADGDRSQGTGSARQCAEFGPERGNGYCS